MVGELISASNVSNTTQVNINNEKEAQRMITDMQNEVIVNLRKQLSADDINFTGGLSDNIEKGFQDTFGTVDLNSPYAFLVEFGMPPGVRVNFDALKNWVKNKLGVTEEAELNAITAKIQNKIAAKGIPPKRFVKKALKAFIAKRGIIRSPGNKRPKLTGFERALNRALKITKGINKALRKVNRYKTKISRTKKGRL